MSDTSQGPGWWQASDGKWYPPEQAPGPQQPGQGGGGYGGTPYGGGAAGGSAGDGTDIGSTFSYAWNKLVQNIGEWLLLWLIAVGITIVVGILLFAVGAGAGFATDGRFAPVGILLTILASLVTGVLLVVLAKAAAQAVNGQKVDIGGAFQLTGNNITAGLVFGLILGVVNLVPCVGWILQLGVFAVLGFLPVLSALDDKGAEAISEAATLSTSRPGEGLLFWLIGGVITSCCFFLGAPIAVIGGAYLVKRYRGELVA